MTPIWPAKLLYPGIAAAVFRTGFEVSTVEFDGEGVTISVGPTRATIPTKTLIAMLVADDSRALGELAATTARLLADPAAPVWS